MAECIVLGVTDTPHADKQPRFVRARKVTGGVSLEVDGSMPGTVLDYATAKILAACLVALSRPEGTES
jgi:hypothetical protein